MHGLDGEIVLPYTYLMVVRRNFQEIGKSLGIRIPKEITDALGATPGETEFELLTDGDVLLLTKVTNKHLQGRTKTFTKNGGSQVLFMDRHVLEVMGIPHDAEMELSTDGATTLMLRPTDPNRHLRLRGLKALVERVEALSALERGATQEAT